MNKLQIIYDVLVWITAFNMIIVIPLNVIYYQELSDTLRVALFYWALGVTIIAIVLGIVLTVGLRYSQS